MLPRKGTIFQVFSLCTYARGKPEITCSSYEGGEDLAYSSQIFTGAERSRLAGQRHALRMHSRESSR